jgi:hypothetical protein
MGTYIRRTLALRQSDDDGGTADRITSSTGALVGVGVVLCLVVLFTAVTFSELGSAWLSGSWHSFWSIANSPLRFY